MLKSVHSAVFGVQVQACKGFCGTVFWLWAPWALPPIFNKRALIGPKLTCAPHQLYYAASWSSPSRTLLFMCFPCLRPLLLLPTGALLKSWLSQCVLCIISAACKSDFEVHHRLRFQVQGGLSFQGSHHWTQQWIGGSDHGAQCLAVAAVAAGVCVCVAAGACVCVGVRALKRARMCQSLHS